MSVSIRLMKMGTKHRPLYRVIAVDSRRSRDGRNLAIVGHYNPMTDPATVDFDEKKVLEFLNCGAQPSVTVRSMLKRHGYTEVIRTEKAATKDQAQETVDRKIIWSKKA
jgi:small subunit ribosomal protein S16